MGWGAGTEIFDTVVKAIKEGASEREIIKALAEVLEDRDWDTQDESDYINNPTVRSVFRELHPDWDWENR